MIDIATVILYLFGYIASYYLGYKISIKEQINSSSMNFAISMISILSWFAFLLMVIAYFLLYLDDKHN